MIFLPVFAVISILGIIHEKLGDNNAAAIITKLASSVMLVRFGEEVLEQAASTVSSATYCVARLWSAEAPAVEATTNGVTGEEVGHHGATIMAV